MYRFGFALLAALVSVAGPAAAEQISLGIDQSTILRVERPMKTVVVGNSSIADVTLTNAQTLVVTGYQVGTTNLIVLDESGQPMFDKSVEVISSSKIITVRSAGADIQAYNCSPVCRNTLVSNPPPKDTGSVPAPKEGTSAALARVDGRQ